MIGKWTGNQNNMIEVVAKRGSTKKKTSPNQCPIKCMSIILSTENSKVVLKA